MEDLLYERSVSVICKTKEARKIAKELELKERKHFSRVLVSNLSIECAPSNIDISRVRLLLVGEPVEEADLSEFKRMAKPSGLVTLDGRQIPKSAN